MAIIEQQYAEALTGFLEQAKLIAPSSKRNKQNLDSVFEEDNREFLTRPRGMDSSIEASALQAPIEKAIARAVFRSVVRQEPLDSYDIEALGKAYHDAGVTVINTKTLRSLSGESLVRLYIDQLTELANGIKEELEGRTGGRVA